MSDTTEQETVWRLVHHIESGEVALFYRGKQIEGLAKAGVFVGDDGRARLSIEIAPPTLEVERWAGKERVGHIATADLNSITGFQATGLRETLKNSEELLSKSDHRPNHR